MNRTASQVTLCITPRERFSCAVDSLRDILGNTARPFELVYIDANSPPDIAARLEQICRSEGFTYVRHDEYLPPNRARNLALQRVETRYAAFLDNDLFVYPGWLEALLRCAGETGAWAVTPVILEGGSAVKIVHMAGGDMREERDGEYSRLHQQHRHIKMPLRSVRDQLKREPVDFFEFHCVLVRTDVFPKRDFLDEEFVSHLEHLDLARDIRAAGGRVYLEPDALVRYDTARPFEDCDREFFELRWSESWSARSIEHARRKWRLAPDDSGLERIERWTAKHRHLFSETQKPWTALAIPRAAKRVVATWLRERGLLRPRNSY